MGVLSWLGFSESEASASAGAAASSEVEILRESIADLELALEDVGWQRLSFSGDQAFSRDGLRQAAILSGVMAVANPLIKRGLAVRSAYVWGQGVQVQARSTGQDGTQDVNSVVQAFLDDQGNRRSFSGGQAHEELERALGTDGNVFLACFTSPLTGMVQVRSLPFSEVEEIIHNPEDRDDPWFYRRQWEERSVDPGTGALSIAQKTAFYPDLGYRPSRRLKYIDGHPVHWDTPIRHVPVNRLDGWDFGIGDAYAALPWARSYRDFLSDWAVLVKALSQFAFSISSKNSSRSQKMRDRLARRPATGGVDGNPNSVGATAVLPMDTSLEAIPKTGATIDSESGRPLAAMVASALGIPVTVLTQDPGQTGARAVAETLDTPTRLEMESRRSLWSEVYQDILEYVVRNSVRAPQGPLRGSMHRDPFTGREILSLEGDVDPTIEVEWPSLEELAMSTIVESVVKADGTGHLPPEVVAKLLLNALGVKDVDEILADMSDAEGNFVDPLVAAGQAAVDAFRRGQVPSESA